jgi:hypothetical protein
MVSNECPECGVAVPLLVRACSRCGAPNPARRGAIAVAAGVVVLVVAANGAIYVATQHPLAGEDDFAWLTSALKACDEQASQQPSNLHFLVIPLSAEQKDMPDWRRLAAGTIGNAMTIAAADAFGGLRRGTLKIFADEYVFSFQDAGTKAVYKWSPSIGAKHFTIAEAESSRYFRVQLQLLHKAEADWGDTYSREDGTCHWVPAIVRE